MAMTCRSLCRAAAERALRRSPSPRATWTASRGPAPTRKRSRIKACRKNHRNASAPRQSPTALRSRSSIEPSPRAPAAVAHPVLVAVQVGAHTDARKEGVDIAERNEGGRLVTRPVRLLILMLVLALCGCHLGILGVGRHLLSPAVIVASNAPQPSLQSGDVADLPPRLGMFRGAALAESSRQRRAFPHRLFPDDESV